MLSAGLRCLLRAPGTQLPGWAGSSSLLLLNHLFTATDPELVSKGPLATMGIGWKESGRTGGQLDARSLDGNPPASIPMQSYVVAKLVLNYEAAKRLTFDFRWMTAAAAR